MTWCIAKLSKTPAEHWLNLLQTQLVRSSTRFERQAFIHALDAGYVLWPQTGMYKIIYRSRRSYLNLPSAYGLEQIRRPTYAHKQLQEYELCCSRRFSFVAVFREITGSFLRM